MALTCKRTIVLFVLSLMVLTVKTQGTPLQCMSRRFPKMIGADNGDTTIERIQLDAAGNMAIGGKSKDSNFISSASLASMQSFAALLAYPTFDYLWAVAFNIYNQEMRDMQFRPGADDQIMIFIGADFQRLPAYLLIINSSTGAILSQARLNTATRGRAIFNSLGQIFLITSDSAFYTIFSLLDLSNPGTTNYNFRQLTLHAKVSYTLIQGKQSLGCYYASVGLDGGALLALTSSTNSYGMIKLLQGPPMTSTWDYFWYNRPLLPLNQEYIDVAGAGGALFTIGQFSGGQLLFTRTHLNNIGNPTFDDDSFIYSESGIILRNLHFRIKSYNEFVGLFTGTTQIFILTVTFHNPSIPTSTPLLGFLNLQKILIVQPVFNPGFIKLGILENMPSGSLTQEFFLTGMKTGTDSCKANFPSAGAGFISYSKQNENCDKVTQLLISASTTYPLTPGVIFQINPMPTGLGHSVSNLPLVLSRTGLTATNISVQNLYLVEPACCNTIYNTPVSLEVLKIGFGPLLIPVPFFTYSEICIESNFVFTYSFKTATKNGITIPVPIFFVLDTLTLASQSKIIVKVTASSPLDVGTYVLSLKGELPNHQSLILPIQVIITTDSIIPSRIPDLTYIIGQRQLIEYNSYFQSTDPLLARFYSIYQDGIPGYDQQIITYTKINSTSFSIKIYSQNDTKPGVYRMEIRAKYSLHSPYEMKSSFQILILERCKAALLISSPIKNITIKVDKVPQNPILILSLPPWTDTIGQGICLPIKYQLKMQNGDNLPSQMRFQKQNMNLIINYMSNLTVKSGIFPLTLKGSNRYFQWTTKDFLVTINCFTQSLEPQQQFKDLTYDIGSGLQNYRLPQFTQSPIECLDQVSYAAFQFPSLEILPDFISFQQDIDLQQLVFTVNAYQNDERISSGMIIQFVIIGNLTLQSGNQITAQQKLSIKFINKNQTNQNDDKILAKISKITATGQVSILFSKDMKIPLNFISAVNQSSLKLHLFDSEYQPFNNIKLNWTVISFEKRFLKLQLKFNETSLVSNQKPWDNLTILFLDPEMFRSQLILQNKFQTIHIRKYYFMSSLIPPQINPNSSFNQFFEKNEDTIKAVLAMNQILFYILSFSLQMLWGMINSLQLVLLLPLVNIWFPSNAQILFKMLFEVFNFEFFDSMQLFKYIMPVFLQEEEFENENATNSQAFNEQFELNGYSSISSVLNLGTMFFYAVGIIFINLIMAFVNIILRLVNKKIKLVEQINRLVFHNILIRFLIESYIQIMICANINFSKVQIQGELAVSLSSIFALLILAFGLLLILKSILIHRLLVQLDNSQQKLESYSAFFESQKHPFPFAIDYTTWYLLRRFLFAIIIVQLTHQPSLQLILLTTQGLATLIYLISVRPFDDPFTNKMEIFNESCLLLAITNLYAFVRDEELEMKFFAGWFIIGIVATQLAANTLIMLCLSIKEGWVKGKRRIQKCKQRIKKMPNNEIAVSQAQIITTESVQTNQLEENKQNLKVSIKKNNQKQINTEFETNSDPQISNQQQRKEDLIFEKIAQIYRPSQKNEFPQNLLSQQNFSRIINLNNLKETRYQQQNLDQHQIKQTDLNIDFSDILSKISLGHKIKQSSTLENNSRKQNITIIPSFDAQLSQVKKNI